tara:strand:+ start:5759 stop:7756 length:1998 start_codon:yes stop_codon:yes gene_type:complete
MPQEFKPQYSFTHDRLNELKQLFPEAWEDGVFNVDTLKTLIGDFSTDNTVKEHFGLNWVGKQDARKIAAKPPTGTLKPCLGEGVNENTTENIFIEGENLEVLKILRKSYMGKIKMIYIDPPYNTGNDFIYKDDFGDSTEEYLRRTGQQSDEGVLVSNPKSSGKFHANWLTSMYPNLRISKDLLNENGILLVHIDENELNNLTLLLNEIYGEENQLGIITWDKGNPKGDSNKISVQNEFILCYTKSSAHLKENQIKREKKNAHVILKKAEQLFNQLGAIDYPLELKKTIKKYKLKEESFIDKKTEYTLEEINKQFRDWIKKQDFSGGEKAYSKIDENGVVFRPVSMAWPNNNEAPKDYFKPIIHPLTKKECKVSEKGWRYPSETILKMLENDEIIFGNDETTIPNRKYLLKENLEENIPSLLKFSSSDDDLQKKLNVFFDNPKPLKFTTDLINYFTEDDDIVLDFFAGSGTTGHSVFELNNKKKLKFICVQIKEEIKKKSKAYKLGYRFIPEVTKSRLKNSLSIFYPETNQGFKTYKQETSTIYKWQDFNSEQDGALPDLFSKMELAYKNPLQDGVTTQDFITEVILQEGFPLNAKQEEVASGIFKITHEWVPYTLYATMLYSFKNTDFSKLQLQDTDHFVCLDKAFEGKDALKQTIDNQCNLFTI